jgi:uncharacterized membrane protein
MRQFFLQYGVALAVFLAIDFVWLSIMGPRFYAPELGKLLLDRPNLPIAFIFYLIFVLGLLVFVIHPAIGAASVWPAIGLGALFGLVAYSTYDLTNLATVRGFTVKVAVVDMLWGMGVSAAVTGISLWLYRVLKLVG